MGMVLNPLQRRIATGRECTIDRCLDLIEHEITRESHVPCLQHSQLAVSRVSSLSASQDLRRDDKVSTTLVRASLNVAPVPQASHDSWITALATPNPSEKVRKQVSVHFVRGLIAAPVVRKFAR